ncbi:MAG TPA: MFS transporter [Gammaproteobacteria bacterium]|nr:MFS transporter [Gammaproteobacteria bacterium]
MPEPSSGQTRPAAQSLLAHPGFLEFWGARVASGFAFQMVSVAVGWQVYALTHRALDLGLIGLVQFIPSVAFALPAGHVADRYERKRIVLLCQSVEGASMGLLALGTLLGWFGETAILAILFVIGVAKAYEFPTTQALMPSLVPASLLSRAAAASASAMQTAMIAGPALGGFLYVAGADVVYGLAALMCFAAVVLIGRLKTERPPVKREPATLRTVFAGIGFIRRRPVILGAISLDLFAVLLGGATALLPIFARDLLHTGPWGLGLLRAAPAVGALLMGFWLARFPLERRVGYSMFYSVAGFGLATLVFALSTSFLLSLAALFLLGALDMVSMVIRAALVQIDTPDEMRGRVSAVNAIFINTSNQLGEFESGLTAQWFGAVPATLIGGIGTLVVVVLWMRWFPELRRRQRLESEAAA